MGERKGRTRRTSAAPLTYWAWPPMREGCCCWSEEDILCGLDSGESLSFGCIGFERFGCLFVWEEEVGCVGVDFCVYVYAQRWKWTFAFTCRR